MKNNKKKVIEQVFYLIYNIIFTLALPFYLLFELFHTIIRPKNLKPYLGRLGFFLPVNIDNKKVDKKESIWIHCVSVGEIASIEEFLKLIINNNPEYEVFISCTTSTGYEMGKKKYIDNADFNVNKRIHLFYFPLDIKLLVKNVIKKISPQKIIILEVEIWPNFIREAHKQNIPIYLINGRIGEKEYKNYKFFSLFFKIVVNFFDYICMQSVLDRNRMLDIGASESKTIVTGNIKFDLNKMDTQKVNQKISEISEFYGKKNSEIYITAASTHRGEEELFLKVFKKLKEKYNNIYLILVPRHPHRFLEVTLLCNKYKLTFLQRSKFIKGLKDVKDRRDSTDVKQDVLIVDTIGELLAFFYLSDIVIMGGSFSKKVGGHNIIEPAICKKCIIVGPYMQNFINVKLAFDEKFSIINIIDNFEEGLYKNIELMIKEPSKRIEYGNRAYEVVQLNTGSSQRNYNIVFGDKKTIVELM